VCWAEIWPHYDSGYEYVIPAVENVAPGKQLTRTLRQASGNSVAMRFGLMPFALMPFALLSRTGALPPLASGAIMTLR